LPPLCGEQVSLGKRGGCWKEEFTVRSRGKKKKREKEKDPGAFFRPERDEAVNEHVIRVAVRRKRVSKKGRPVKGRKVKIVQLGAGFSSSALLARKKRGKSFAGKGGVRRPAGCAGRRISFCTQGRRREGASRLDCLEEERKRLSSPRSRSSTS